MVLGLFARKKAVIPSAGRRRRGGTQTSPQQRTAAEYQPLPYETLDEDPLKRMLQQGRYAMIVREQEKWREHPNGEAIVVEASRELEQRMALVPAGTVSIPLTLSAAPGGAEEDVYVEPFLLDVHAVTNARFQRFVDAGGYDALEYWPEEIWPHLIELKDLTGQPGPRFWRLGRCDRRFADHPIVGISWYEAQAYALWIGQRLVSEGEWQMAASWHLDSSTDMMRRFPWGDAMDKDKCNIWVSRIGGTVPVSKYPQGAAPNHVLQLIGNVWEWTDTEYAITDEQGRAVVGEMPMHVIRGGAFDTYFEMQATSGFRTGQIALARSDDTGFRCAMDLAEATWINGSSLLRSD